MQIFQFAELKHFQSEQRCQNNCVDLYERSQGKSARGGEGGRGRVGRLRLLLQLLITLSGSHHPALSPAAHLRVLLLLASSIKWVFFVHE